MRFRKYQGSKETPIKTRIWRQDHVVRINLAEQAKEIEAIFHKAVQHELSIHKRLGNPIAVWQGDKVVLIPPDQIQLDEPYLQ